jgi:hypothetical protein
MSYEIQYKLQDTSFEIQVTSYRLKSLAFQILPAPADDCTLKTWTVLGLYGAKSYRTFIEFS